jgi:hypothetical protein
MSAVTYMLLLLHLNLRVRLPRGEWVYSYLYGYMTSAIGYGPKVGHGDWRDIGLVSLGMKKKNLMLSTGRRPGDKYSCSSVRLHGVDACERMSQREVIREIAHDLSVITTLPPNPPGGYHNPSSNASQCSINATPMLEQNTGRKRIPAPTTALLQKWVAEVLLAVAFLVLAPLDLGLLPLDALELSLLRRRNLLLLLVADTDHAKLAS